LDLTIGVVPQGSIYDEILYEMLDHQGVAYRIIGPGSEPRKYPLVLLSKNSEEPYSSALRSCDAESSVIVAEKAVAFDAVLPLLSGTVTDRRDNFDLVVNKEEEKLLSAVRERLFGLNLPFVRKWYWPGKAKACCVFTHDIDWFDYSPFHKQVARESSNPIRLLRLAFDSVVRRRDYGWNIPETTALEQEYGFKATVFFQMYYPGKDLLEQSAEILKEHSFEVGLHGAQTSQKDPESLREEMEIFRKRIGMEPKGLRYHILKFEVPRSWEIETAAGFEYDATFYYNRFFGFRAGTCFPYHPFSQTSRLPILELPTGYMDWTSLHQEQGAQQQLETLERTRKAVEGYNGILVANFHNTYLNPATFPSVYGTFRALLETAKTEGYWVATALESARWWQHRASTQINPRLESGEVVCSPSSVDVQVERESKERQMIAASQPT
jgi:peptidoglycan/xylan/chitin deacetylase (PgdA/CDA1 family)